MDKEMLLALKARFTDILVVPDNGGQDMLAKQMGDALRFDMGEIFDLALIGLERRGDVDGGWVDASVRVPEVDGWIEVIVLREGGAVGASDYWSDERKFWPANGNGEYWAEPYYDVTHWKPMPNPPDNSPRQEP